MASKSKIAKAKRNAEVLHAPRDTAAGLCGRPRAVYRKFGICRICFRKLADEGLIPGVRKRVGKKRCQVSGVGCQRIRRLMPDISDLSLTPDHPIPDTYR